MTEAVVRKKPGMASVREMPVLQDGPPPGGFPPVRYARRIPSKGPSAVAIFLAAVGAFSWGMYQVGQGNRVRRSVDGLLPDPTSLPRPRLKHDACVKSRIDGYSGLEGSYDDMEDVMFLKCELKEEKYAARRAILPILQAEEDERFVKEWNKYLEEEARIMKDVPGWKVGESVYNSGKWVPPSTGELRPDVW
ncbi:NADH dehydrogenase (ubiquinone) 1 alpha subcomplex [Musa troglodytarum]|uniref:NADH dehydrogenase [ubiquinone] 1 alpha subcomplex subunit 13 n=1 Tax=Musa troglodytarum TaxID=320322 RepID=A0A9E7EDL4_9LILI|nr:NADH dehydrogenase (ubiquinone) 1 alpha subcomplex [Musa troglodytarum]